jgi:membrane protease subunit HflK
MAWNDPGGGDRDPWSGSGRNQQGPPDLDELFKKLQNRIRGMFGGRRRGDGGGGKSSGIGIGFIVVVVLAVWLLSGFYVVDEGKRGVVLLFGDHVRTSEPGPHWHLPYPIGEVRTVDVAALRTVKIGYEGAGRIIADEALMLTGDRNIISVLLAVQWRVSDPSKYLFTIADPEQTLKQIAESALREVVGRQPLDFVATVGRAEVVAEVEALIKEALEDYDAGIEVVEVADQDVQLPEPVQEAVAEVERARATAERLVNEANAYRSEILPEAQSEAARIRESAVGNAAEMVTEAEGETAEFLAVLNEYQKTPDVTRQRLYIEALESVLTGTRKVLVSGEANAPLTYLPLDRLSGQAAMTADDDTEAPSPDARERPREERLGGDASSPRARARERGGR